MSINVYDEVVYAEISKLIDEDMNLKDCSIEDKEYLKNTATDVMMSEYDFNELTTKAKYYIDKVVKGEGF